MTTTPRTWLDEFIGARLASAQPDGRPLYAWRCSDTEYEALRTQMRAQLIAVEDRNRFVGRGAAALFCLYAAEAWRRTHESGGWKWQTVLDVVGIDEDWYRRHYRVLTGAVGIGLEYWRRQLLTQNGTHEYLLTLACEGGLPLRLLEREGTRLRGFFLALQDESRRLQRTGDAPLAALAQRLGDCLPPSLRQPVVFQLAGRLIAAIEALPRTAGATDPLARLDAVRPGWRDELPLTLADGPLRALLGCLLIRPAVTAPALLRWRCGLETGDGTGYALLRRLDLPPSITGSTLADWLRTEPADLAPRYRLLIGRDGGMAPLALATRLSGSGDTARYRLELIARTPVLHAQAAAFAPPPVVLLAGDSRPLPVGGADELSELPWVFSDPDGSGGAEWLGAGNVRVREASALVALPDGYEYSGETAWPAGRIEVPARALLRVTGALHWCSPDGESGRVRCADVQAGREDWRLHGPSLADARNTRPVYLGLPRLQQASGDASWTPAAGARIEWRTAAAAPWQRDPGNCRGRVQVRAYDADGELRVRSTIDVLPPASRLRYVGEQVHLDGLGAGWTARAVPLKDAAIRVESTPDGLVCCCMSPAGSLPPPGFEVDLDWADAGCWMTLALPFPLQGGVFTYLGAVLRDGAAIPVGRLGAATLEVQAGAGGGRFLLEGELQDPDGDPGLRPLLWFRHEIRLAADARTRLNLGELEESVGRLFGATHSRSALDATVRLHLRGAGGRTLARADLARFGLKLEPDRDHGTTRFAAGSDEPVDPAFADRLNIEALPLWAPQRELVPLAGAAGERGVWPVADILTEPGPWLLIGRDGDWRCVRPLLWTVRGGVGSPVSADSGPEAAADTASDTDTDDFAAAVRSPADVRDARYARLYAAMAGDPTHAAWPAFDALFALARELPPATFDACRRLVAAPAALVTALLRATDASFDAVWSLAEALPFDWPLLPVADWFAAAAACHARYTALADAALADTLLGDFCTRLTARGPVQEVMADWLRRELLAQTRTDSCLAVAALPQGSAMLRHLIDEERQRLRRERLDADWPQRPRVLEAVEQYRLPIERCYADEQARRAVLCAPFVSIALTCGGHDPSPALRHELRRLRDFDPDWFDRTSAFALCLELAAFHPARPDATA